MASRLELHEMLCMALGSNKVYYQPPESLKISHPCIIYSRAKIDNIYANNDPYHQKHAYKVIVVDSNPDSLIVEKVSKLPMCRFEQHYCSDNMNHDIFMIYY